MFTWPICPKCNKEIKHLKMDSKPQITDVLVETKCKKCTSLVRIRGNGQTELVHP